MELFERTAAMLGAEMPVYWLAGPEEELADAVRIENLYDLACWLRGARGLWVTTPAFRIWQRRWGSGGRVLSEHGPADLVATRMCGQRDENLLSRLGSNSV